MAIAWSRISSKVMADSPALRATLKPSPCDKPLSRREGGTLNCAPSADAVAGNGRPLSWAPSADAVTGRGDRTCLPVQPHLGDATAVVEGEVGGEVLHI